jgi:hypothetical protein
MYVNIYFSVYVYKYIRMHQWILPTCCLAILDRPYIRYIYSYIYMCICKYIHMYTYVYIFVHIYVYMYMYTLTDITSFLAILKEP